jgi:predicted nucleic acid-binding Zn ribbon protein
MAREATCKDCGKTLGIPEIAKLGDDGETICEDCAPNGKAAAPS